MVIIAGPNGSGKSTLTKTLIEAGVDFGEYINPDEIATKLEGTYDARVRAAQAIADDRRETCVRERRSFTFETVMSHPSKLALLRAAYAAGFFVQMYFVAIDDPLINVSRVANRVAKGGHDVPLEKIVERYSRVLDLLPQALQICDAATVLDNSRTAIQPWLTWSSFGDEVRLVTHQIIGFERSPNWIADLRERILENRALSLGDQSVTDRLFSFELR